MKIVFYLFIITVLFISTACDEDPTGTFINEEQTNQEGSRFQTGDDIYVPPQYIDTQYGGCFGEESNVIEKDICDNIYCELSGDTLTLFVNMSYNCCGGLVDSVAMENEIVNIYIWDACTQYCICDCICDFEFQFSFVNVESAHFIVYLKGFGETGFTYWNDLYYEETK